MGFKCGRNVGKYIDIYAHMKRDIFFFFFLSVMYWFGLITKVHVNDKKDEN